MLNKIKQVDSLARQKYTYIADKVENWRSHAKAVRDNQPWFGDCDDLASTVAHLSIEEGMKLSDLWFVMVSSQGDNKVDHLVAVARVENLLYVIGDTFGKVYLFNTMKHKLLYIHRLDWPLTKWLKTSSSKDFN